MIVNLEREVSRLQAFAELADAQVRPGSNLASRAAVDEQFFFDVWAIVLVCTDIEIDHARQQGRELARRLGCSAFDATMIATVVSELARTIVAGAWPGKIILDGKRENTSAEITIRACVQGPATAALASQKGGPCGGELGSGLRAVQRIVDEFEIISHPARGTTLFAKKRVRVAATLYKRLAASV